MRIYDAGRRPDAAARLATLRSSAINRFAAKTIAALAVFLGLFVALWMGLLSVNSACDGASCPWPRLAIEAALCGVAAGVVWALAGPVVWILHRTRRRAYEGLARDLLGEVGDDAEALADIESLALGDFEAERRRVMGAMYAWSAIVLAVGAAVAAYVAWTSWNYEARPSSVASIATFDAAREEALHRLARILAATAVAAVAVGAWSADRARARLKGARGAARAFVEGVGRRRSSKERWVAPSAYARA